MSRLYLLRHAHAHWPVPGTRDLDRPLDARGHEEAQMIGIQMKRHAYVAAVTLCSTARRARETLEGVVRQSDAGRVVFCEKLYHQDAAAYLDLVRLNGDAGSVLVIGHNPMMEDVAQAVSQKGNPSALAVLRGGFPTAGLAVIDFPTSLRQAAPGNGFLEAFCTPRGV